MSHLRSNLVRTLSRATLGAVVLACLLGGPVFAQQDRGGTWSQFQGDPAHSGAFASGPEPPYRQAWRFVAPEGSLSGAVITGEVAIAVGEGAVYALELGTGQEAWEVPRDGGPISMPAVGARGEVVLFLDGPPSTEGGAEDEVTPQGGTGATGGSPADQKAVTELVAVSATDREELWRTTLEAQSRSGVTVEGDLAIVADDEGTVYAVELATGSLAWSAEARGRVDAPPAVADGHVYVVARDSDAQRIQLVALDEQSGDEVWRFTAQAGAVAASAASAGDGSVVVGSADRLVRRLGGDDGEVLWDSLTLTLFSPVTAPAFVPRALYVADAAGGVYGLDPSDGTRRWEHQLNEVIVRSSPVVSGPYLLVGLNDGRLVALDPENGDLVWQSASSQGLIGSIALSSDLVVAVKGGKEAGLVAFEHDPEGSLVRVPSPTVADAGRLVGNYALALVIASVVIYLPFRFLRARMGPAFAEEEGGVEDEDLEGDPDPVSGEDEAGDR